MLLVAPGEAEDEVADDVALDFGGTGFDGVAAGAQVRIGPEAVVDGVGIVGQKLTIRPEEFLRYLLEALI